MTTIANGRREKKERKHGKKLLPIFGGVADFSRKPLCRVRRRLVSANCPSSARVYFGCPSYFRLPGLAAEEEPADRFSDRSASLAVPRNWMTGPRSMGNREGVQPRLVSGLTRLTDVARHSGNMLRALAVFAAFLRFRCVTSSVPSTPILQVGSFTGHAAGSHGAYRYAHARIRRQSWQSGRSASLAVAFCLRGSFSVGRQRR